MDRLCWCISLRECATRPGLGTYRFPTNHPTAVCSQPEITLRCTTLRTKYARPSSTFTFTLKLSLRRPGVPTCLCKHLAGLLATTLASHCTALGIVAGPRGDEAIAMCGAIDAGRRVGPTSRTQRSTWNFATHAKMRRFLARARCLGSPRSISRSDSVLGAGVHSPERLSRWMRACSSGVPP